MAYRDPDTERAVSYAKELMGTLTRPEKKRFVLFRFGDWLWDLYGRIWRDDFFQGALFIALLCFVGIPAFLTVGALVLKLWAHVWNICGLATP